MFGIVNLSAFLLAATMVIAVPGPATFYVAAQAHRSSWEAVCAISGIVLGDMILIAASGLGFAGLVSQWPVLLLAVKLAGAAYLSYLAWELLRSRPSDFSAAEQRPVPVANPGSGFVKGVLLTVSNPKPLLFFAAFFPMFIQAGTPTPMPGFYALGLLFELLNLSYFAAIILLLGRLRTCPGLERFFAGSFNRISGYGLLLCCGFILVSLL